MDMKNVKMQMDKSGKLTITIDTKAKGSPSKTGKTNVIASTHGNQEIPGFPGAKLGLNLFVKA